MQVIRPWGTTDVMISNPGIRRLLGERHASSESHGASLLELAYKLRQAEFRVFGRLASDEISLVANDFCNHVPSVHQGTQKPSNENVKEGTSLFSSLDFSIEDVTPDISLKSIQELYRSFKASFPRYSDECVDFGDNCTSDTTTIPPKDNLSANSSQKIPSPQKSTSASREFLKQHACDFCSYQTDSRSHLFRHLRAVHQDVGKDGSSLTEPTSDRVAPKSVVRRRGNRSLSSRRFKCDMCLYSTDCLSHLRRHQGCVHNKMMSYWCYICKKEFSRSEKTKAHFLNFHPNIPYDPRKIRKVSPQRKSKAKNSDETMDEAKQPEAVEPTSSADQNEASKVETSGDTKVIATEEKGYSKVDRSEKKRENPKQKSVAKGREKHYACQKCNYVTHGQWHMKRHMVDVHEKAKEFSCRVCCYAASRQHRMLSHMRTHGEVFCLFCEFSSADLEIFKRHFDLCSVVHRVNTVVRCHVCQIECQDPKQLKVHINETHSVILHSCDTCPYYTDVPDEIYTHARLHVEEELTCKPCNMTFKSDDELNSHVEEIHVSRSSDGSYVCVTCNHGELTLLDIIRHLQTHGPENFACDLCNFKSTVEDSLQLHMKYHHSTDSLDPNAASGV